MKPSNMLGNPAMATPPADPTMVSSPQAPPTNKPMQPRRASPNNYATSGMERAMGQHADRVHPVRRK